MSTDDTMRRIEEALDDIIWTAQENADTMRFPRKKKAKYLATIRAALPKPIPISRAEDIEEWRRRNADDPGNIAVAVELDGSCTVPGMAFVVTEHDGTVTRFVPTPNSAQPSPTSGESPAVSAEVAQKDAGGWGEDDDRFHANEAVRMDKFAWDMDPKPIRDLARKMNGGETLDEEHERAVEAWRQTMCQEIESLTKHANKPGSEPKFFGVLFGPLKAKIDEALRLMRWQPTVQKPTNPSAVSSSETTNTETTDG